jgi:hypothetical protein
MDIAPVPCRIQGCGRSITEKEQRLGGVTFCRRRSADRPATSYCTSALAWVRCCILLRQRLLAGPSPPPSSFFDALYATPAALHVHFSPVGTGLPRLGHVSYAKQSPACTHVCSYFNFPSVLLCCCSGPCSQALLLPCAVQVALRRIGSLQSLTSTTSH